MRADEHDGPVVTEWATKLSPLCDQPVDICETWLAAFLTAIRLNRCQHVPEEDRSCGHDNPVMGAEIGCYTCNRTMGRREGHTEAGLYWTAGEVIELASRR